MGTRKAYRKGFNDLQRKVRIYRLSLYILDLCNCHSGDRYEGEFLAGFRDGYGTITKKSGDKYEGNWSNDRRQGTGVHYYPKVTTSTNGLPNAEKYVGEFSDDKIQGKGELIYDNGMTVKGNWRNGAAYGIMAVLYPNGDVYTGEWTNGRVRSWDNLVASNGTSLMGMAICFPNRTMYTTVLGLRVKPRLKVTSYPMMEVSSTGTMIGQP